MKGSGIDLLGQDFVNTVNVVCSRWVGWRKVECVGGVCVYMNGSLSMHKCAERANKECNVGAAATFIDMEPSDVFVVVDVMTNE